MGCMINNWDLFRSFLKFEEDCFYWIMISFRWKDHRNEPVCKYIGQDYFLKHCFIRSYRDYDDVKQDLIDFADRFGARIYITPSSLKDTDVTRYLYKNTTDLTKVSRLISNFIKALKFAEDVS